MKKLFKFFITVCACLTVLMMTATTSFAANITTDNGPKLTVTIVETTDNNVTVKVTADVSGLDFDAFTREVFFVFAFGENGSANQYFTNCVVSSYGSDTLKKEPTLKVIGDGFQVSYSLLAGINVAEAEFVFNIAAEIPDGSYTVSLLPCEYTGEYKINDVDYYYAWAQSVYINDDPFEIGLDPDYRYTSADITTDTITIGNPAPTAATYTADFRNTTEVDANGAFTTDLYLTGEGVTNADFTLAAENGTITSIALNVGLTQKENANNKISFYQNTGDNAVDFTGGAKVATITVQTDSTKGGENCTLSVTEANANTTALTVTGVKAEVDIPVPNQFTTNAFANGRTLVKYTGTVEPGSIVKLNGTEMYYDGANFVTVVEDAAGITNESFQVVTGAAASVWTEDVVKGDVNGDGKVNSTDMQLAYDIYMGNAAADTDALTYLRADVTGNGSVTANDARNVQCIFHGIAAVED